LPGPQTPKDSLVIGYFSLYFPGEYFNSGKSVINSNIELDIRDVTTGRWIFRFLSGGYFQFLAHGGDTYSLVTSRANLLNGSMHYVFGPRPISLKIDPVSGKVLSLGKIQLNYSAVREESSVFHPRIDFSIRGEGGGTSGNPPTASGGGPSVIGKAFSVSISQTWDDAGLLSYMRRVDPTSLWLSRDIVDVKMEVQPDAP
jgi:hypothetical protein